MLVEEAGAGVLAEWGGWVAPPWGGGAVRGAGQQKKMQVRQRRVVGKAEMRCTGEHDEVVRPSRRGHNAGGPLLFGVAPSV